MDRLRFLTALCLTLATTAGPLRAWQAPAPLPSLDDELDDERGTPPSPAAAVERDLHFERDLARGLELARESERPLVVIFGAEWCGACRSLREGTLTSSQVRMRGPRFVWVSVDVDRRLDLARRYEVAATPTLLVLSPGGRPVARAEGDLGGRDLGEFLDRALAAAAAQDPDAPPLPFVQQDFRTPLVYTPGGYRGLAICFNQVGYGPLRIPSQSPGQVLRLGLEPRTPSTLGQGQLEVQWTSTLSNIWAYRGGDFRLDYATLFSHASVAYGLTNDMQLEVGFVDLSRFDSILDPLTTWFHDAFGLPSEGRDLFPSGQNVIFLAPNTTIEDSGSTTQDLSFTFHHNLTCGNERWPAFSYSLTARSNLSNNGELDGDTPLSFGISLAASKRVFDDFYLYAAASEAWHGMDSWAGLPLRTNQFSGLLALEWRYRRNRALTVQYLRSQGVALSRDPFDDASNEIVFGYKHELGQGTVLEFGVLENLIESDNSPDIGFHFGLRHRF